MHGVYVNGSILVSHDRGEPADLVQQMRWQGVGITTVIALQSTVRHSDTSRKVRRNGRPKRWFIGDVKAHIIPPNCLLSMFTSAPGMQAMR